MNTPQKSNRSLVRDQRGLTTVEYIIVLGLIAVFGVTAWKTFGSKMKDQVVDSTTHLGQLVTEPNASKGGDGAGQGGGAN